MDAFTITLLAILVLAFISGFIAQTYKDKCLRHFHGFPVILERVSGKMVKGLLHVHSSGLEFIFHRPLGTIKRYQKKQKTESKIPAFNEKVVVHDADKHQEASYIFYKYEYEKIQVLIRYYHDLSQEEKEKRDKLLKWIYHPGFFFQLRRKSNNLVKKLKKSFGDIIDLSIATLQTRSPAAKKMRLKSSSIDKLQEEISESVGVSYEPLLEKYIGYRVIFELLKGDRKYKYVGILRDYSKNYLEFMDVKYAPHEGMQAQITDMVVPQRFGIVRSYAERSPDTIKWLQHLGFWINKPEAQD